MTIIDLCLQRRVPARSAKLSARLLLVSLHDSVNVAVNGLTASANQC